MKGKETKFVAMVDDLETAVAKNTFEEFGIKGLPKYKSWQVIRQEGVVQHYICNCGCNKGSKKLAERIAKLLNLEEAAGPSVIEKILSVYKESEEV